MTTLADNVDRVVRALENLFKAIAQALRLPALIAWLERRL